MFVRQVKRKTTRNIAVQIVHSQRFPGGKVKQKIFRHVGSAPPGKALEALVKLAHQELQQARLQRRESLFPDFVEGTVVEVSRRKSKHEPLPIPDARQLQGERTFCVGIHDVFGGLYDELGLDAIWSKRHRVSAAVFRHTVLARLACPGVSKLGYVDREAMYFGIEDLPVEKIYRMMDHLTPARCEQLRQHLQDLNRAILEAPPTAVLMDVTTLAFASEKDDDLRKKGYSKDGKPHRVQVVLALIQSPQGLPIDYAVFPGNTGDVSTLQTLVATLKQTHGIQHVTAVMDAGMMSQDNLKALTEAKIHYVVAARIGQLSLDELRAIHAAPNWETSPPDPDQPPPDEPERLLDWRLKGRRLVLRYSPAHAQRDAEQRDQALAKANAAVEGSGTTRARGGLRFVQYDDETLSLDADAIEKSRRRDGLHGVWTDLEETDAREVRATYGSLWRIEYAFRVIKHTLQMRPVFHWTERRVHAHIAICYAAFALLRHLHRRYQLTHSARPALSEARLLHELGHVQVTRVNDRQLKRSYLIPNRLNADQQAIYTSAKVQPQLETLSIPADG